MSLQPASWETQGASVSPRSQRGQDKGGSVTGRRILVQYKEASFKRQGVSSLRPGVFKQVLDDAL